MNNEDLLTFLEQIDDEKLIEFIQNYNQKEALLNPMETEQEEPNLEKIAARTKEKLGMENDSTTFTKENTKSLSSKYPRKKYRLKYIVSAAAILLIICCIPNYKAIAKAITSLYYHIVPNQGIVPGTNSNPNMLYILSEKKKVSNDKGSLTISFASVSPDKLTLSACLTLEATNSHSFSSLDMESASYDTSWLGVKISIDGKEQVLPELSSCIVGGSIDEVNFLFDLDIDSKDISKDSIIELSIQSEDLHNTIQLTSAKDYADANRSLPTVFHNDIGITLTTDLLDDNILEVHAYPIDNSKLYSPITFTTAWLPGTTETADYKELILKTETGSKEYFTNLGEDTTLISIDNNPFYFDLSDGSKELHFTIPGITVYSNEKAPEETFDIPDNYNTPVKVDKNLEFDGCTIHIDSVEKITYDFEDYSSGNKVTSDALKLNYTVATKKKNATFKSIQFNRTLGENYAVKNPELLEHFLFPAQQDQFKDDIPSATVFQIDSNTRDSISVEFVNPNYLVNDNYTFDIDLDK